jgi:hypothetical protein
MSNPFDFVNSILQEKEPIEDKSEYVPFLTNRSLSYHYDTILHANEMNMRGNIDKEMQYDYLFHSVRKYKRQFKKWHKEESNTDIDLIKEFFAVSTMKAKEIYPILTESNLLYIKEKLQKGGNAK